MTDHKKPSVAFWATVGLVVTVVVALCAYAGAYARMVRPVPFALGVCLPPARIDPDYSGASLITPGHRDQAFWEKFFGPANWLDRQLRPKTWSIR